MSESTPSRGFRLRKLRIAFSVACGILCLLLIVLWVRSYWWVDSLRFPITSSHYVGCWSVEGTMAMHRGTYMSGFFNSRSRFLSHDVVNRRRLDQRPQVREGYHGPLGFGVMQSGTSLIPYAPHWFYVFLVGMIATLPWVPPVWRFSLRTLLIAMTVTAALLGAVVWAVK